MDTPPYTLTAFHHASPFGNLHQRIPEIQQLAQWQGRTPSSMAMKLVNFASLDPQIIASGRARPSGASKQNRSLWEELQSNWDAVAESAANVYTELATTRGVQADTKLLQYILTQAPG